MPVKPEPDSPTKFHPHIKKDRLTTLFLSGKKFQDVKTAVVHLDGHDYPARIVKAVADEPLKINFTPTHVPRTDEKGDPLRGSSDLTITLTYNGLPLPVTAAPVYYES